MLRTLGRTAGVADGTFSGRTIVSVSGLQQEVLHLITARVVISNAIRLVFVSLNKAAVAAVSARVVISERIVCDSTR